MQFMRQTLLIIFFFCSIVYTTQAQRSELDSLRSSINPAIYEDETIDGIVDISDILINQGKTEEAKAWLDMGFEIAGKMLDQDQMARILSELGNYYINKAMPDSASAILEEAESYTDKSTILQGIFNFQGIAYSNKGNFILSIDKFEKVKNIADSLGLKRESAAAKMNMGVVYSNLGDYTNSLKNYYESLEYAEQVNDSSFMAVANNNVGLQFHNLEIYDQSDYYLRRAETLSRNLNFTINLRRSLVNLGNLYKELDEIEEANEYYSEALQISEEMDDMLSQVQIYYNLGQLNIAKEEYQTARELFTYSLDISKNIESVEGQYYSSSGMGELEMEQGNIAQAIRWFARAHQIIEGKEYNKLRLNAYENLYKAYKLAGNSNETLRWLESKNNLSDSLNSAEQSRLLAEYQSLFNIKQKEQESEILRARQMESETRLAMQQWILIIAGIAIFIFAVISFVLFRLSREKQKANKRLTEGNVKLNNLNQTIQQQNEELEKINGIKDKLFAIVAHDLRGPLSSLQSLLYLIRDHNLSKKEMEEISDSLERNLQENAAMMDNLLAWAKSQMQGIQINFRDFKLNMVIQAVIDQIKFQADKKAITLKSELDDNISVYADYDMIKLVVRNLAANAIKFSSQKSNIYITANIREEGDCLLKVKDEGVGMSEEVIEKLFGNEHYTSRGTDNEKGSGLGLTLCKDFIEKHGGEIWLDSKPKEGTTFYITIPAKREQIENEDEDEIQTMQAETTEP